MRVAGWVATGSASSAVATATKQAVPQKQHIIYGVSASFSVIPGSPVLLQILDEVTSPGGVLFEQYISAGIDINFNQGLTVSIGSAVLAVLASGGSIGKVNLHGITM